MSRSRDQIAARRRRARCGRRSRARAPTARASSRLVTLTHAMTSSSPTAPSRIHSVCRSSSLAIQALDGAIVHADARVRPDSAPRDRLRDAFADPRAPRRTSRRASIGRRRRIPSCRDWRSAGARTARRPRRESSHGVPARQHADDRVRPAVEHDRPADDRRIAAEALRPEAVRQHHALCRRAGIVFAGREEPAGDGRTPSARKNPTLTFAPLTRSGDSPRRSA